MATPLAWQRPLSSATATSLQSSTIFPVYYTKRHLFIPCSPNFYSSSSCCSSVNNASNNGRKRLRGKSVELTVVDGDPGNLKALDSPLNISGLNGRRVNFKSLFGKRALWRRIFFASKKVRSIILLNVITIIYASNIPVVKEVEAIIDPEAFTVVRFVVAAIPFMPFVFQARNDSHTRKAGLELGFWVSLGYILQALGLLTSDAGRASFLCMFTVIVVPLIDGMLGSKIPAYTWFGALASIVGVAMLESSGSPPCIGDLLNFLSAVSFGIHMLRTEQISRSTERENLLPLLGYEVCVVAFLSTLWYFTEGWFAGDINASNPFSWTWTIVLDWISSFPWIPALYTGIFQRACAYGWSEKIYTMMVVLTYIGAELGLINTMQMTAMRDVSATETAIIYGLEPVWGAGFAWFLLGERWGVSGWIGAALVLGGSLTVQIMGAMPHSSLQERSDENGFFSDNNILSKSSVIFKSENNPSDLVNK